MILKINQKLNWKLVYKEQRSSTACTTRCVLHYACLIIIYIICILTIRHRLVVCTTLGLPNYYIIGIFTINHHLVALHYDCLIIIYILCIFTIKHRPRWCLLDSGQTWIQGTFGARIVVEPIYSINLKKRNTSLIVKNITSVFKEC